MSEQLNRISEKLIKLKNSDSTLCLFGANEHEYELNNCLLPDDIKKFELKYNIKLPEGYSEFLTKLGNGGAGPFYGLEPLENTLFSDLDFKNSEELLNPSIPFPHTQAWNMDYNSIPETDNEEENERLIYEFENEYFSDKYLTGVLAICNYGCGVTLYLVVSGDEYGNIWTDDRGSDGGIYPSTELGNLARINFLDWYELWLDNSLKEIETKKS